MAVISFDQYMDSLAIVNGFHGQLSKRSTHAHNDKHSLKLSSLKISERLFNCLCIYFKEVPPHSILIGDLSKVSLSKFRRIQNAGEKTVAELLRLCNEYAVLVQV